MPRTPPGGRCNNKTSGPVPDHMKRRRQMPHSTEFNRGVKVGTLVLAASLALAGCAKKAPPALPPAPEPTTATAAPPPTNTGPVAGSQADFVAQMMGQDTIYFDTDKFDIDQV